MKLKRKTFQYIESEIYSYWETLKEIKLMEYEILNEYSTYSEDPQAGRTSVRTITDTTALKATALVENKQLRRMKEKTEAISKVYESLIEEKKELIELRYWKRPGELTWDGIAKKLNVGRATAIRWRNDFVYKVAEEMGES